MVAVADADEDADEVVDVVVVRDAVVVEDVVEGADVDVGAVELRTKFEQKLDNVMGAVLEIGTLPSIVDDIVQ